MLKAAACVALAAFAVAAPPLFATNLRVEVVNESGKPLANAVVYAIPAVPVPSPEGRRPTAIIDQIHRQFAPQVNVVETGTVVYFPNSDNIMHSVYSFSPAKTFVLHLYAGRRAPPVTFDKAGIVVMGCQIHDTMIAWLLVVKTPYFGKTNSRGVVVLRHLESGGYRLHAWHVAMRNVTPAQLVRLTSAEPASPITIKLHPSPMPGHGPAAPGMPGM